MFNKPDRYAVYVLAAMSLSGCTYIENNEYDSLSVSSKEPIDIDNTVCRTFGFRNWSLQRDEGSITLGAQASMPTPGWSVILHHSDMSESSAIEFVVETIEPSGMSNSVVTWISFETTIDVDTSTQAEVLVKCAGEVVWSSQAG